MRKETAKRLEQDLEWQVYVLRGYEVYLVSDLETGDRAKLSKTATEIARRGRSVQVVTQEGLLDLLEEPKSATVRPLLRPISFINEFVVQDAADVYWEMSETSPGDFDEVVDDMRDLIRKLQAIDVATNYALFGKGG